MSNFIKACKHQNIFYVVTRDFLVFFLHFIRKHFGSKSLKTTKTRSLALLDTPKILSERVCCYRFQLFNSIQCVSARKKMFFALLFAISIVKHFFSCTIGSQQAIQYSLPEKGKREKRILCTF